MLLNCKYCNCNMVRGEGIIKKDILLCLDCSSREIVTVYKLSKWKALYNLSKQIIKLRHNASNHDLLTRYNTFAPFALKAAFMYKLTGREYFKDKMEECDRFFSTITIDDLE